MTPLESVTPVRPAVSIGWVDISGLNWRQRERRSRGPFAPPRGRRPQGPTYMFLPYSVGLLEAYVKEHAPDPARYDFRPVMFRRQSVDAAIQPLLGADVVGFSVYCWNIELSLEVARTLRERQPDTLIVFGGPEVPDRAEAFLRKNPCVDVACHGEGEATFLSLLEGFPERDWREVGGISFLTPDGAFVTQPKRPRLKDMNEIPSPYLSGVFESLIRDNKDIGWHILWETNRGCPFSCTFCDWGSATASKIFQFDMARLQAEVDWFADKRIEFIFVCDANFGILPRDLDLAKYIVSVRGTRGFPYSLGVQNTKNVTERAYQMQKLLASISTSGVTIAMQSVDPHTLQSIKRANISTGSFQELQRRYVRDKIPTYTDVIIGLPGESYHSFANGVQTIIQNGQYNRLQFYNCYLLPNAEMASDRDRERFEMATVRSRMVIDHEPVDPPAGQVDEFIELVVSTKDMPREDWARTKALCWMTDLLHCDRVLQVPLAVIHAASGIGFRIMLEAFTNADPVRYPIIAGVEAFFLEKARDIQNGGDEYCASREWLEIAWPADEYALIQLATTWKLDDFYAEAEALLLETLASADVHVDPVLVRNAVQLNQLLLRLPFELDDERLELDYDVWECYQDVITGAPRPPVSERTIYNIRRSDPRWLDWDDWLEDLARRQKDKPAFLYAISRQSPAIDQAARSGDASAAADQLSVS